MVSIIKLIVVPNFYVSEGVDENFVQNIALYKTTATTIRLTNEFAFQHLLL